MKYFDVQNYNRDKMKVPNRLLWRELCQPKAKRRFGSVPTWVLKPKALSHPSLLF